MFKAVFVDDEIIVREGIERRVDWKSHGFELAGTFSHGLHAKEYLEAHPDIKLVFTDISMPVMDGLELARYISEHHPHIYVLILTGYDEFEYAREAIKYHVRELLLKPITAREVGEVLDRVHRKLAEEQQQELRRQELMDKLSESLSLLQTRFLNRLAEGRIQQDEIAEQLASYQLPELHACCQCVIIDTALSRKSAEPSAGSSELYDLQIFDLCREHLDSRDMLFFNKDDQPVCILQHDSPGGVEKKTRSFCETLKHSINQRYGEAATFGVGGICSPLENLGGSYRDALRAIRHQYVLGKNRIIWSSQLADTKDPFLEVRRELEDELLVCLKTRPAKDSRVVIRRFFQETFGDALSLEYAQVQTHLLLSRVLYFIEEAEIPVMEVMPDGRDHFSLVSSLSSREEVEQWFFQLVDRIHGHISARSRDQTEQRIRRAVSYLEAHYSDPQLSVHAVCSALNMSVSHFSSQFKRVTGKTFVEYLTTLRVQQASMLLKTTNICAYEAAEAVGYEDSHYFSQVFKKVTGMTIREYRNMFTELQEETK